MLSFVSSIFFWIACTFPSIDWLSSDIKLTFSFIDFEFISSSLICWLISATAEVTSLFEDVRSSTFLAMISTAEACSVASVATFSIALATWFVASTALVAIFAILSLFSLIVSEIFLTVLMLFLKEFTATLILRTIAPTSSGRFVIFPWISHVRLPLASKVNWSFTVFKILTNCFTKK